MAQQVVFTVRGSQGDLYTVTFARAGNNLTGTCTCAAGAIGQYCKHRFALMAGEVTDLASDNTADVQALRGMIAGTDVAAAMTALQRAEAAARAAQNELSQRKRALARTLRD
jgi:uncharacterized Zn finger protein